ncbi:MAG: hypothetical protein AAGD32_06205 [Planctomycetota bacterium]
MTETYHLPMPFCPRCRSTDLYCQRSAPQGDGSRLKYFVCLELPCGHRFKVVLEPPEKIADFPHGGKDARRAG